jgi:hypothetical protein
VLENVIRHDGKIHHPLGGGSYVFEKEYIPYLAAQLPKEKVAISIGAQPNSSPHLGTLVVFATAFSLAEKLREYDKKPEIHFQMVDTAPGKKEMINGVTYQRSLKEEGTLQKYLPQYHQILETLEHNTGIKYKVHNQEEFNSSKELQESFEKIMQNREIIGALLEPETKTLRARIACDDCGLTDKHNINTEFFDTYISSVCPEHGQYITDIADTHKIEFSTPLRNLLRGMAYARKNTNEQRTWMRVTGSDYAGYYQEQLLYRAGATIEENIKKFPQVVYAPLITDWSGAKLSKSLYVNEGAYGDIPEYLLTYEKFRDRFKEEGMKKMLAVTRDWMQKPYKLFRTYSVYYLDRQLNTD